MYLSSIISKIIIKFLTTLNILNKSRKNCKKINKASFTKLKYSIIKIKLKIFKGKLILTIIFANYVFLW